jgi:hypothetical protein
MIPWWWYLNIVEFEVVGRIKYCGRAILSVASGFNSI